MNNEFIFDEEIFFEGNYSDLKPTSISRNKLRINSNCIFLTIFDGNFTPSKFIDGVNKTGISLVNCNGIVVDTSVKDAFGRKVNNRKRYTDIKSGLSETSGKKIPVLTGIRNMSFSSQNKEFYFLDMSYYMEMLLTRLGGMSPTQLYRGLFYYLSEDYKSLKKQFPSVNCDVLLITNTLDGPISDILGNANKILNKTFLSKFDLFNNYMFVSTCNQQMIPIAFRKNLQQTLNLKNINYSLQSLFKNVDSQENSEKSVVGNDAKEIAEEKPKKESESILNKIVKDLSAEKLITNVDNDGNIKPQVDNLALKRILKRYKITDPDILANVKAALDMYIDLKGDKLSEDEAVVTILKAINYTVHGKEELDEKYIKDPKRLILKLKNISTHKTSLEFPESKNIIINPGDIINIRHTTGVWRQKQEFDQTIHTNVRKLFETLENSPTNPVKIQKIDYDVIDDDVNRYLLYKITLKNQSGGKKTPYTVELKVPASVNDRYFKINGSTYIMATQQMLKPVTKTEKDQVRMLSSYSVVRIGIKNLKFNPADIDDILNYVNIRYPKLIETMDEKSCVFKDGSTIYLVGDTVFKHNDYSVSINVNTGKLMDGDGNVIKKGKYEFLYEIIIKQVQTVNKEDKLTRTKKTIPYIYIYIGGVQLPLILYMWQLKGLVSALNDFGIDYELSDEKIPLYPTVKMKNGKFLVAKPKSIREELIANGLLSSRIKNEINDLEDAEEIHPWIDQNYGSSSVLKMRILTQNQIDPVTRELLEFENLPTNLPSLISEHCVDKLLNDKMDSLADLKIYRARLSEMILNIMYKQITAAHNHYSKKIEFGDDSAQIVFNPDWIMNDIMSDGSLQHSEPVSPVDEIFLASRTIKSGKGGVPKKTMFKPEHRNIHPSHYGIMSANTTPEGGNVGLIVSHTLTPVIVNEYGSYGMKDISSISGWDTLSINEALIPFQNELDYHKVPSYSDVCR